MNTKIWKEKIPKGKRGVTMKRMSLLALIVLVSLVLSGCGGRAESASDEPFTDERQPSEMEPAVKLPAEEESLQTKSEVSLSIGTAPNLDLFIKSTTVHDLGDGLERWQFFFNGRNSSQGWYYYTIAGWQEGMECVWTLLAHEVGASSPILSTSEGYTYNALTMRDFVKEKMKLSELPTEYQKWWNFDWVECGVRQTVEYLPPGALFAQVEDDDGVLSDFGWAFFDLPKGANPAQLEVPYACRPDCGLKLTTIDLDDASYLGPWPIDPTYNAQVFRPGEIMEIGEIATLVVESYGSSSGSIPVSLSITNLHSGYSLEITRFYSWMLGRSGEVCCRASSSDFGLEAFAKIGPLQERRFEANLQKVAGEMTWLSFSITLREGSPQQFEQQAFFVVELP